MAIQLLYLLAIKIPQSITTAIVSNVTSHLISLLLAALSYLRLLKSPPDPVDYSGNYILILDGNSPSLFPVPVHVITASIKNNVPIIPFSDFAGARNPVCTVCLDCIDDCHLIRKLVNCKHVFHRECLDQWIDMGQVNCPLCRCMLLSTKKLLSTINDQL